MYPKPQDPEVVDRMRAAHRQARIALEVRPGPDEDEAWGWHGRTLSQPVTAPDGFAWLRLACSPAGQSNPTFWNGSLDARNTIPATVPRPRMRAIHDFNGQGWEYRAELYDYVATRPVAPSPTLTAERDLPPTWWTALRGVLNDIATVATHRYTTEQQYLNWAMPKFLDSPVDTCIRSWTTAHGDLHWANICAPELHIFDWEGWGLAPTGYDAAMLHSYSLRTPRTAAMVRIELADILNTPAGRFAELATITELLHSTTRGDNLDLAAPLRQRAAHVLEHTMGLPPRCGHRLLCGGGQPSDRCS